jgi:hypothetical protein
MSFKIGMIDDQTKNIVGVVFKEVQQETGITLNLEQLITLGSIIPSGTIAVNSL